MNNRNDVPASWASWSNVVLGIWLIIAPFVLNFATGAAFWNSIILGIVVLVVAYSATQTTSPSPSWWNVAMGIWLIISPFVLGFITAAAFWNTLLVGIVVALMGLVAALAKQQRVPGTPMAARPSL